MTDLEKKIQKAQEAYYAGSPIMNDIEFDELWDQLKKEQPDSELLKEVGSDLGDSNGFPKAKHDIIMGSQNKANTEEDMKKFLKSKTDYIVSYKMDGSSVALYYKSGKLTKAVSRGDGSVGVDYTPNVIKMEGVVQDLGEDWTGTVRGEVLLRKSNKEKYFPEFANCRNAATGVFHRKDGEGCEHLTVVCYDAQRLDGKSFELQTKLQCWIESHGFIVAPWCDFAELSAKDAMAELNRVFGTDVRAKYDFDIDGLVIKQNKIDMDDIKNNYRPTTQIALKPARTIVKTVLKNINWKCHNGTYTPVAEFEPVDVLGSTCTQASLANLRMIENLGLEIGHEIEIVRTGEIVPKVIRDCTTGKFVEGYCD